MRMVLSLVLLRIRLEYKINEQAPVVSRNCVEDNNDTPAQQVQASQPALTGF